jgi:hypothetical protein
MRVNVWVVTGLACAVSVIGVSARIDAQGTPAPAAPTPGVSACDQCEDLCRLVDVYEQREAGIKMWRQYASKTPKNERVPLPTNLKDFKGFEGYVEMEFNAWASWRRLPCTLAPGGRGGDAVTALETTTDSSCTILYNKQPLTDQNRPDFERGMNCKPHSDAVIEHEKVHQKLCQEAYAKIADPKKAQEFLDDPANIAQSEVEAWEKERDVVAEQIRKIVRDHDCGWDPTQGQKGNPNALPSQEQTKKMQERGWRAVESLRSGGM